MSDQITLCCPNHEKSCFACCPPIRPHSYEHIQYRNIIKRILRENTRQFVYEPENAKPITGFSCWALGYLDETYRTVGCLLHPARHGGVDLRYKTGYGDKCRREQCPESKVFSALAPEPRLFYLGLTTGLDSFEYSSRKHNPLFALLGWGADILETLYHHVSSSNGDPTVLEVQYPVLLNTPNSRAWTYPLRCTIEQCGPGAIRGSKFAIVFNRVCKDISVMCSNMGFADGNTFTHRLDMDKDFLNLIRLGVGIRKINSDAASLLKEKIDQRIDLFIKKLSE